MFSLDHPKHALVIDSCSIQMLLVGAEQTPYFKCNDAAKVLGYIKYSQAVTNHVRPRQIKTLQELLKEGVPVFGGTLITRPERPGVALHERVWSVPTHCKFQDAFCRGVSGLG